MLSWITTLPTELSSAVLVIQYWDKTTSPAVWITILLLWTFGINMLGVRGYGESEFVYSAIKVITILGWFILGIVSEYCLFLGGQKDEELTIALS